MWTKSYASKMESIFYMVRDDFKIQIEGVTSIFKKGQNIGDEKVFYCLTQLFSGIFHIFLNEYILNPFIYLLFVDWFIYFVF